MLKLYILSNYYFLLRKRKLKLIQILNFVNFIVWEITLSMTIDPFSMAMTPFCSKGSKIRLFLVQVTNWIGGLDSMWQRITPWKYEHICFPIKKLNTLNNRLLPGDL